MKKFTYGLAICCILAFVTCKEEDHEPLTSNDQAPAPITEIHVENLPGAARLSYVLPPNSQNLLYVKAEFETQGIKRDARASYYNNTILLEGFGDTQEHEVKVYAVNRSEVQSTPVTVTVKPLDPPVNTTFQTLTIGEDFGGTRVTFSNAAKADLTIFIMHQDADGFWVEDEVLYTKKESGAFSARGLESVPTVFGVYVQDRWNNFSDTLVRELTPLFEKEIPKPFAKYLLTSTDPALSIYNDKTDADCYNANTRLEKIWDGKTSAAAYTDGLVTKTNNGVPATFTFDLLVTARLSRFRHHQRQEGTNQFFGDANIRYYEIWGRADAPTNPSWDGWVKLMDVESVKPSGLPVAQNTDEDIALVRAGEEFNFPLDAPPVRWIRIRVKETWGKLQHVSIGEMTFWGQF
ncbi:MAG: DUF5000 domain-containing lipoprotein [Mangrovibacterium sp.]